MKKILLFCTIIVLLFLTFGCINNSSSSAPTSTPTQTPTSTPTQTPKATIIQTPTSNPTPDNVLRLYTKTLNEELSFQFYSCTHRTTNLKEGDKVEVSITGITGGNGKVISYFTEWGVDYSGKEGWYSETLISRDGTNSWTVPHDGRYSIGFSKEDVGDKTYRDFNYEFKVSYIDTNERNLRFWDLTSHGCG